MGRPGEPVRSTDLSIDPTEGPGIGQELVKQLLGQMNVKYVVDDEGDLAVPWEEFRTYFMFRGEAEQRIFSVRSFYDRTYSLDEKPQLLELLDDWNRNLLWPKVYSHTSDDGSVRVIAESHLLLGAEVSVEHFTLSLVSWMRADIDFSTWLGEQLTR
jgi:hypothetical protein